MQLEAFPRVYTLMVTRGITIVTGCRRQSEKKNTNERGWREKRTECLVSPILHQCAKSFNNPSGLNRSFLGFCLLVELGECNIGDLVTTELC